MTDIFGRNIVNGQTQGFSADTAILTVNGITNANSPLLVQNFSLQYAQPVSLIFDLSSNATAFVRGRSRGGMSMSNIIGPARVSTAFLKKYGSVCNMAEQHVGVTFPYGCESNNGSAVNPAQASGTWKLNAKHAVIESVAYSAVVDNMLITGATQMLFASLEIQEN